MLPFGTWDAGDRRRRFDPWVGKIPWRRKWQPTPVLLPGKSHGQRSLVGFRPWGLQESDMTVAEHTFWDLKFEGRAADKQGRFEADCSQHRRFSSIHIKAAETGYPWPLQCSSLQPWGEHPSCLVPWVAASDSHSVSSVNSVSYQVALP